MPDNYTNPNLEYPLSFLPGENIPGIALPDDFAIESADRSLVGPEPNAKPTPTNAADTTTSTTKPESIRFPTRRTKDYGEAIARLVGAFSGPGFNLIFRPHAEKTPEDLEAGRTKDDLLELNLTHEIWTFPTAKADLGPVPNRVANDTAEDNKDITLQGVPYTQIVREVTTVPEKPSDGRILVDKLGVPVNEADRTTPKKVQDIHFESGLFVNVPPSSKTLNKQTICRMASIPHGTTINAQGEAAIKIDGNSESFKPIIPSISPTPFRLRPANQLAEIVTFFANEFDVKSTTATRLPQILKNVQSITQPLLDDPNTLLREHNEGKKFTQVITFKVTTAPVQAPTVAQRCPHLAAKQAVDQALQSIKDITDAKGTAAVNDDAKKALEKTRDILTAASNIIISPPTLPKTLGGPAPAPAIGTANIAFLDGAGAQKPHASTAKVESTFWISTVVYTIQVPKWEPEFIDKNDPKKGVKRGANNKPIKVLTVNPIKTEKFNKDTVPSFVFPADKPVEAGTYTVEATQIQYSQNVILNFNGLAWPHISVATVVPIRPILINNAVRVS
jgi:hypothetical protein